jgi:predicted nucleotide-binding protein
MTKPRLFIGSASESRSIVDALEEELRDKALIERWDVDIFRPGHFTLEELKRIMKEVDFVYLYLARKMSLIPGVHPSLHAAIM